MARQNEAGTRKAADADFLEECLIYLACSDYRISSDTVADYCGSGQSLLAVTKALREAGLTADDLDKGLQLPPHPFHMIFAPRAAESLMEINSVEHVPLVEAQRLRMLGVLGGSGSVCRGTISHYKLDGKVEHKKILYISHGGKWNPANPELKRGKVLYQVTATGYRERELLTAKEDPIPGMACVEWWAQQHTWGVEFRLPSAPGIRLNTDSTGAKELLRMRDVPEGRTRREALKHWVHEHWRKLRNDPDVETQVRQHLRGADRCSWFGLECRIIPSVPDRQKNEHLALTKVQTHRAVSRR